MSGLRKYLVAGPLAFYWPGILVLSALVTGLVLPRPSLAAPGTWSPAANTMSAPRSEHSAILLPSGKVLLTTGDNLYPSFNITADLFAPALGTFSLASLPSTERHGHTTTLLPNGKVLVAGGTYWYTDAQGQTQTVYLKSAELYEPGAGSGTWTSTSDMSTPRRDHTATLLPNGKVLVVGGYNGTSGSQSSAELFDPAANSGAGGWSATPDMQVSRSNHTATLLPSGKVMVVGGSGRDGNIWLCHKKVELYDPFAGTTGTWDLTGPLFTGRILHTTTLLPSGKVLVAGGMDTDNFPLADAELYDPVSMIFGSAGTMTARDMHTATLLLNGKVLVAGGFIGNNSGLTSAELYDPLANSWVATGPLGSVRYSHTATRLQDGRVLAAGGLDPYSALATAELYDPAPPPKVSLPPLLAFYPFEGNANDASGHNRHGAITGSPQVVAGYQGQAYSFNGTSDYITMPLDINPGTYPKLTMGGWAKTTSGWPLQTILTHDNGDFDRSIGIDFRARDDWKAIGWSAFCGTIGAVGQVLGAVPAILNQWTFVAAVYDQAAQTVKFQVDDMVFIKTGVTPGSGHNQLFIGNSPDFSPILPTYFAGVMDNIFVFGDALSDQQLAYIRNGGAPAIITAAKGRGVPLLGLLLLD